ncbi:MAG: hypoxanthine phosphoribosyltransferase [Deltaproteobacteria bacterium]|nr:MAG: hypoxanthine phosphoribosyltransferase [Deltaproteobacteria bacterium]
MDDYLIPFITKDNIEKRLKEIAEEINKEYGKKKVILIGILKGAFMVLADLIRYLNVDTRIDFIQASSYGSSTVSSGKINIIKDVEMDLKDQDVIIVEDILDTGITLNFIKEKIEEKKPNSLKFLVLIDKKMRRKIPFEADYVGFTIEDGFIVGYGIDVDEKYRHLPDIFIFKEKR